MSDATPEFEPEVSVPLSRTARWRLRSYRDPVTGLFNLRYLRVQFMRRGAAARRTLFLAARLVGLADIHAREGAETADGLLRRVARTFREAVGYRGLLFHLGGGEFVATFLNGDMEMAVALLREFRAAACAAHGALAVIFGWATSPAEGVELSEVLRVAFARMNAACSRGPGDTRLLTVGGTR